MVSFGSEHAPFDRCRGQRAWEEAKKLFSKRQLLIFTAFQFDPEAAREIDEMNPYLAGMQFLKVQMNADLLTEDPKKNAPAIRASGLLGSPM